MPFIVTPSELNRRADFYHQLQQLTSAGLGIVNSLDQLRRNSPSRSYRVATGHLLGLIQSGQALGESMRAIPFNISPVRGSPSEPPTDQPRSLRFSHCTTL